MMFNGFIDKTRKKVYIFCIATFFLVLLMLYIGNKLDNYALLSLVIVMFILSVNVVKKYHKLKKIDNYLIENKLVDKIGNIVFTDEKSYFFAENYLIVCLDKRILCFKYSKIKKIYKEYWNKFNINAARFCNYLELYLHFILQDNTEFKILTDTSTSIFFHTDENYQRIVQYLLKKNSNIIICDETLKNKVCMK